MDKILIIGQAPPAQKQSLPYDTTMLYDWFEQLGISKEDALDMFLFDAVYDKFPGYNSNGGHLKPNEKQMEDYWERGLKQKIDKCKSILVLGACARDFLKTKEINKPIAFVIHPSKRNYSLYLKNKDSILKSISSLINFKENRNEMKKKLQEGYSFCEECKGTGATPDYMDCRNSSNNCCGGCDWVHKECPECRGCGEIETDEEE